MRSFSRDEYSFYESLFSLLAWVYWIVHLCMYLTYHIGTFIVILFKTSSASRCSRRFPG